MIEPVGADDEAFTVSVLVTAEEGLAVTEVGLREQVSPVVPVQEELTVPVNPSSDVRLIVSVVELPAATVSVAFPDESAKSGRVMAKLIMTDVESLPLVPWTITVPVCGAPGDELV